MTRHRNCISPHAFGCVTDGVGAPAAPPGPREAPSPLQSKQQPIDAIKVSLYRRWGLDRSLSATSVEFAHMMLSVGGGTRHARGGTHQAYDRIQKSLGRSGNDIDQGLGVWTYQSRVVFLGLFKFGTHCVSLHPARFAGYGADKVGAVIIDSEDNLK